MDYQLVLRLRSGAVADIATFETELQQALAGKGTLDGHDLRPGQVDVFLVSSDPASAFRRLKPVLEHRELLTRVTAAHRVVGGQQFKVIWPLRYQRRFTLD
jgi:hypothetical protein